MTTLAAVLSTTRKCLKMRLLTGFSTAISVCLMIVASLTAQHAHARDVAQTTAAAGVAELKFHDFFKLPIGPRGLEPTQKLLQLNGQRVRITGYMARQENPTAGLFILTPLPVAMGDEDDSLADDLPAAVVFVHIEPQADRIVPYVSGLLKLSGTLQLGSQDEADGHVSTVRLILDPALAQALLDQGKQRLQQAHR
jgi:hypothetical protein